MKRRAADSRSAKGSPSSSISTGPGMTLGVSSGESIFASTIASARTCYGKRDIASPVASTQAAMVGQLRARTNEILEAFFASSPGR